MNQVIATTPTIGSNVEQVQYKNITFTMWDLGGQEGLRATWATYYVNTRAIIMVVDSCDRDRIQVCATELHQMLAND